MYMYNVHVHVRGTLDIIEADHKAFTWCSDESLSPLENISPDDKLPLLVVGEGSERCPAPWGEGGRTEIFKRSVPAFDDELNPVAPTLLVVNPFVTAVSVAVPVVVDSLAVDVPGAPEGFVWLGRML